MHAVRNDDVETTSTTYEGPRERDVLVASRGEAEGVSVSFVLR